MRIVSVNVSGLVTVPRGEGVVTTGIYKRPIPGEVGIGRLGVEGDAQGDRRVHGGPHKAVYAYTSENLDWWGETLGRHDLTPGAMGENLTTEGLDEADVCIGDRFAIGSCILEVSEPRTPCATLAMAIGDAGFPRRFLESGRVGFYLRVVAEGRLRAGDGIRRTERAESGQRIPVGEVSRVMLLSPDDLEGARRCLTLTTLGPTWRERFERRASVGAG